MQPEESEEEEEASDEDQASDFEAEELGGKKGGKKTARGSAAKRGRKAKASEVGGMGWDVERLRDVGQGAEGQLCCCRCVGRRSLPPPGQRLLSHANMSASLPSQTAVLDGAALRRARRRMLLRRRRVAPHQWMRTSSQQRTPPARWGGMICCVTVSAAVSVDGSGVQAAAAPDNRGPCMAGGQAGGDGMHSTAGGAGNAANGAGVCMQKAVPVCEADRTASC